MQILFQIFCLPLLKTQTAYFFFFSFVFIQIEDNVFKFVNIFQRIEVLSKKTLAVEYMGGISR